MDNDSPNEMKLFEQHWNHIRHVETQRLTLTSIFAVAMGGFVSYVWQKSTSPPHVSVVILVISLFGLISSIKVRSLHETHKRLADLRLEAMHHGPFVPQQANRHWSDGLLSISGVFTYFYALCFGIVLFIRTNSSSWTHWKSYAFLWGFLAASSLAGFSFLVAKLKKRDLDRLDLTALNDTRVNRWEA